MVASPIGRTRLRRCAAAELIGRREIVPDLVRTREWSCQYRFWSDGSHNPKPAMAGALVVGGIAVGIVVAVIGIRRYRRTRRPIDLLVVAVGLVPLIAALAAVLLLPHGSWAYDCSTG